MIEHRSEGDATGTLYRVNVFDQASRAYEPLVVDGTTEHCWSLSLIDTAVADLSPSTPYQLVPLRVGLNYEPGTPVHGYTSPGRPL